MNYALHSYKIILLDNKSYQFLNNSTTVYLF